MKNCKAGSARVRQIFKPPFMKSATAWPKKSKTKSSIVNEPFIMSLASLTHRLRWQNTPSNPEGMCHLTYAFDNNENTVLVKPSPGIKLTRLNDP
jgi:hypothetical protein